MIRKQNIVQQVCRKALTKASFCFTMSNPVSCNMHFIQDSQHVNNIILNLLSRSLNSRTSFASCMCIQIRFHNKFTRLSNKYQFMLTTCSFSQPYYLEMVQYGEILCNLQFSMYYQFENIFKRSKNRMIIISVSNDFSVL